MMPDIPKLPPVRLTDQGAKLRTAGEAVRLGIATHAEKHRAALQARHHALEANLKITRNLAPKP